MCTTLNAEPHFVCGPHSLASPAQASTEAQIAFLADTAALVGAVVIGVPAVLDAFVECWPLGIMRERERDVLTGRLFIYMTNIQR